MAISEVIPGYGCFHVKSRMEVYDELDALLLDQLLDHLKILALIASVRAVPDTRIAGRLAVHPRYRPYLDGKNSPEAVSNLLRLLHDETQLLLTLFTAVAMGRDDRKESLYRRFRPLVPYIDLSDRPAPAD
jgi:hypothetical protein